MDRTKLTFLLLLFFEQDATDDEIKKAYKKAVSPLVLS